MKRIEKLYWKYYILNIFVCISTLLSVFGVFALCVENDKYAFIIIAIFVIFIVPVYLILLQIIGNKAFRIEQLLTKYR